MTTNLDEAIKALWEANRPQPIPMATDLQVDSTGKVVVHEDTYLIYTSDNGVSVSHRLSDQAGRRLMRFQVVAAGLSLTQAKRTAEMFRQTIEGKRVTLDGANPSRIVHGHSWPGFRDDEIIRADGQQVFTMLDQYRVSIRQPRSVA